MCVNAAAAIEVVYRVTWGRVAALIRLVGDFDLAENVRRTQVISGEIPPPLGAGGQNHLASWFRGRRL
jgi:predicted RNA polymerase sigma factor